MPETIAQIHAQGGLAVASHPHIMKSEWGKNTLYLWENHEKFAPLIDAWEIANRNNIFDCVGMKRLPFLANSDFHKPKHIYSWKTLLYCEKERGGHQGMHPPERARLHHPLPREPPRGRSRSPRRKTGRGNCAKVADADFEIGNARMALEALRFLFGTALFVVF